MTADPDTTVREAAARFSDSARAEISRFGGGNINDTYLARLGERNRETHIVLQRINDSVFPNPRLIVANMVTVGPYLDRARALGEETFEYPRLLPDRAGNMLWVDADGACWRAALLIGSAVTVPVVRDAAHAGEVGRTLGRFHRLTADLDAGALHDTLPGFHNCPKYVAQYDAAVAPGGSSVAAVRTKAENVQWMMGLLGDRRGKAGALEQAVEDGHCRRRTMHGDPKADNVLIDKVSGRGVGMLDFDTVKPGLWHYDFGDAARSVCNPAGEDAPADSVVFDMERFSAFAAAYVNETRGLMPERERSLLGTSVWLLTFELGVRFLADYLAGDVYFRVKDPDRNRRRALVQFRLCADIERHQARIEGAIRDAFVRP